MPDYHRWYSSRIGHDMGVVAYGHWGAPILAFPTSLGDEWEHDRQGMVGALAEFIDAGRIKLFAVGSIAGESLYARHAHPAHRTWMLRMYDEYVHQEVVPFIRAHCRSGDIRITSFGASLGACFAVNAVLKHPDVFTRCIGLSGAYDLRLLMNGHYDDNLYFNNPVDYAANLTDRWYLERLAGCEIRLATGRGPWERPELTRQLSHVLASRGIAHHVDDWGAEGGHDWPYWHRQMRTYVNGMF